MNMLQRIGNVMRADGRSVKWQRWVASTQGTNPVVAIAKPATLRNLYKRFKRPPFRAYFAARRAVLSNLNEVEHLTYRLGEYRRLRPRVAYPLPEMRISPSAELELTLPPDPRHPFDRVLDQEGDLGDIALARDPGAADAQHTLREAAERATLIGKELAELETEDREIERQMSETTEKRDAVARDQEDATTDATKRLQDGVAAPDLSRRTPVPSAIKALRYRVGQWLLLIVEGVFIFVPLANAQGVDPTAIGQELMRNPLGVLFAAGPALALAWITFITLQWSAARSKQLIEEKEPNPRRPHWIAAIGGAIFLALSLIWVTASMRSQFHASANGLAGALEGAVSRPSTATVSYFLITLAAVVGAVILHATADRLAKTREDALQRAAMPTTEEAVAARRARQFSAFEDVVAKLQERRAIINAKIALLSEQEQSVRRALREFARAEQHAAEMFVDDVRAAIGCDKYQFRLVAKKRKRGDLLGSPVPPSQEPDDTVVDLAHARRTR